MDLIQIISSKKLLDDYIEKAKDWALLHGLIMRSKKINGGITTDNMTFVPFTLLPSKFPRANYELVNDIQLLVNSLMHRVAYNHDFIKSTLADVACVDEFTKRLLNIYNVKSTQSVSLGLLRADYMIETDRLDDNLNQEINWNNAKKLLRCKQVEVNTIASGQGWIGTACTKLHRYVLEEMGLTNFLENIPENNALEGLCHGMLEAWKIYNHSNAIILFVVEETTVHIGDQRQHEYMLRHLDSRIRVLRRTLGQISQTAKLIETDQRLQVDGYEIALVYMRSGYSPEQYPTEAEWQARELIERSKAIKCPSIGYQLSGTKKVQQMLVKPGCLELFMEKNECERLRRFFTGLYSLDLDEIGDEIIESAIARPDLYVLKPQREGGANNLFGADLKTKLISMKNNDERTAWILMDRIEPIAQKNYMIHPNSETNDKAVDVTSELGIFGVILGDKKRIFKNEVVGHTLRTKFSESDEGGVSSGFGACDSPLLI